MDFVVVQEAFPSRHLAVPAVGDGFHDGSFAATPQPDFVGQVRACALYALAFVAVADEAVGGRAVEDGVAAFGTFFIVRRTGEGKYVVGGIFHAFLTQGWPPRRHDADAAFGDGLLDLLGRTAPQPVVVGEVGEAGLAFGIRAVALDAVGVEQVFAETLSLRVCRDLFHRHIGKFAVYGRKLGVGILHFFFILVGAGPTYCTFVVAQAGIDI